MAQAPQLTLRARKAQLVAECQQEREAFAALIPSVESACGWADMGFKAVSVIGPKLRVAVPAVAMFALSQIPATRGIMGVGKKAILAWQIFKRARSAWQGFRASRAVAAAKPVVAR